MVCCGSCRESEKYNRSSWWTLKDTRYYQVNTRNRFHRNLKNIGIDFKVTLDEIHGFDLYHFNDSYSARILISDGFVFVKCNNQKNARFFPLGSRKVNTRYVLDWIKSFDKMISEKELALEAKLAKEKLEVQYILNKKKDITEKFKYLRYKSSRWNCGGFNYYPPDNCCINFNNNIARIRLEIDVHESQIPELLENLKKIDIAVKSYL